MRAISGMGDEFRSSVSKGATEEFRAALEGYWSVRCFNSEGKLKWEDEFQNLVVNEGLVHVLNVIFTGTETSLEPWYIGLLSSTPSINENSTLTPGGNQIPEFTNYSEANLQLFDEGTATSPGTSQQQVSNAGNEAVFTINQDNQVIGGAFLASTNAKPGVGGGALLYCAGAFTGLDKTDVDTNDQLRVTAIMKATGV